MASSQNEIRGPGDDREIRLDGGAIVSVPCNATLNRIIGGVVQVADASRAEIWERVYIHDLGMFGEVLR